MSVSSCKFVNRFADPLNLDATVEEVAALVLGCTCHEVAEVAVGEEASLMAVIGFGGVIGGACILRCSAQSALTIAGRMMNATFSELDTTVQDAMGELCNMVAGGWKGRVPELSSECRMSVPAVITGRDYQIRVHSPQFELSRSYGFDDVCFEVRIVGEVLQKH